ncbi:MAG: hypothetical protein HYX86_01840, partial [Chloroflexi bacterium]|nr:hypothetical protein [Chloroflexota bacterium]
SDGQHLAVSGSLVIGGEARDNTFVRQVEVQVDSGQWSKANGAEAWTYAWDTSAYGEGSHTLRTRATDAGENVGSYSSIGVVVDRTPPAITQVTTPQKAYLNGDGRWTADEHVVVERQVDLAPGETETIEVEFDIPAPVEFWIRAALTDEEVLLMWTGKGEFAEGEIEDYLLNLGPPAEPTPTPTPETPVIEPTPEHMLVFTDEMDDTFICDTLESAPGDYPAADIEEVQILSRGEFMEILVRLAQDPLTTFEEEFSWAVLVIKRGVDGTEHAFLAEIHDGVVRLGEFDLVTGEVVPDTEEVITIRQFEVGFAVSQALTDTEDVLVLGFNLPIEGGVKGCDEAGPFQLQDTAGGKPQVLSIEAGAVDDDGEHKIFFNVDLGFPPLNFDYTICGRITWPNGEVRGPACVTDTDRNGMVTFSTIPPPGLLGTYEFSIDSINDRTDFQGPGTAIFEYMHLYVTAISTGYRHTMPGVESLLQSEVCVGLGIAMPVEGALVEARAEGPGIIGASTASGTTAADGCTRIDWRINQFGTYTITVNNVTKEGELYDPSMNLVNSASIEVGQQEKPLD